MHYYGRFANGECFHSNYGQAQCFYNLLHKLDLHLLLKYLAYSSETAPVRKPIKVVQKFIIHAIVSHVPLAICVSWCQVYSANTVTVALSQVHRAIHMTCCQAHSAIHRTLSKIHSAVILTPANFTGCFPHVVNSYP